MRVEGVGGVGHFCVTDRRTTRLISVKSTREGFHLDGIIYKNKAEAVLAAKAKMLTIIGPGQDMAGRRGTMAHKAYIIKSDGTHIDLDHRPTLTEAQKIVGGFVEPVYLGHNITIYVNEEGVMRGLPVNV